MAITLPKPSNKIEGGEHGFMQMSPGGRFFSKILLSIPHLPEVMLPYAVCMLVYVVGQSNFHYFTLAKTGHMLINWTVSKATSKYI